MTDSKKLMREVLDGKREAPSMGCQIDATPCSICGRSSAHTHKDGVVIENGVAHYDDVGVQLISVSLVDGPKCATCGEFMVYTQRSTIWKCDTEGCADKGNEVNPGFGGLVLDQPGI
jgi:hypothetical protein